MTLRQEIEAKHFGYLAQLGRVMPEHRQWYEVYLHKCDLCQSFHTLSIMKGWLQVDRKGNQQKKNKAVIDKFLVTDKEAQAVTALRDQIAAPPARPPAVPRPEPTTTPADAPPAAGEA